jgi:hypothetical protein
MLILENSEDCGNRFPRGVFSRGWKTFSRLIEGYEGRKSGRDGGND